MQPTSVPTTATLRATPPKLNPPHPIAAVWPVITTDAVTLWTDRSDTREHQPLVTFTGCDARDFADWLRALADAIEDQA